VGFTYTHYFEQKVLRKRPYLRKEWCVGGKDNASRPGLSQLATTANRKAMASISRKPIA